MMITHYLRLGTAYGKIGGDFHRELNSKRVESFLE